MQDIFGNDNNSKELIKSSLSIPRMGKYLVAADGDLTGALEIYRWNARLSQSLYIYVQTWEVCLRNKMNDFLSWKYSAGWPYDHRFARNLNGSDRRKLQATIIRQESNRGVKPVQTSAVVADLSAGFWVSQLSYDIPNAWRYNIGRIFPHGRGLNSVEARAICADILGVRNRIAHHEPVFHLPLHQRRDELRRMVQAMCAATLAYAEATCTFHATFAAKPHV